MIQISLKTGRDAISVRLICGRKVPSHRKASFHFIKLNDFGHKRHHFRCYSTKVIRGYSNGNSCDVKYSKHNSERSLKSFLEVANNWNNSFATYLMFTMKRAAALSDSNIFYFKQNLQTPSGTIHASSSSPSLYSSSRHHGTGGDKEKSSPLIEEDNTLWSSVKVRIGPKLM